MIDSESRKFFFFFAQPYLTAQFSVSCRVLGFSSFGVTKASPLDLWVCNGKLIGFVNLKTDPCMSAYRVVPKLMVFSNISGSQLSDDDLLDVANDKTYNPEKGKGNLNLLTDPHI